MKLSSPIFVLFLLLTAVISGCRREKTEPFGPDLASSRPPLAISEARSQDIQALQMLAQNLLAGQLGAHKGSFQSDLLGPQILLTLLLNASENESLEQLATQMKVPEGRHDLFTKSLQCRLDALRTLPGAPVKQGTALWMIWPILLTPDFQNEMGDKLGASVYRLGNAGITSAKRIEAWQIKSGATKTFPVSLDKRDVMTATLTLTLDPGDWSKSGQAEVAGRSLQFYGSSNGLKMVMVRGSSLPEFLSNHNVLMVEAGPTPNSGEAFGGLPDLEQPGPQQALEASGFGFIFSQPNDWRYLSIELRQASLSSLHGRMAFAETTTAFQPEEEAVYLIFEPKSELIIAGGRLLSSH